ncbi:uncharacterized protein LOC134680699 [Mytilus trossulus]|uniref:uncharacterized protein LOC134680699 n=1 Tax=Mytilus trossulus TaxID=6551 RepID=UPI0030059EFF
MSSRKRPARHDPNDPMHWTKEQYVTHLKSMGITVKSTWRLDMIRQLYFVNQKDLASSTESGQNGSTESSNTDEVTVAAENQPNVDTDQPVNENNTMSQTADMLKDSTSALKSANEAMSAMSSMVVGLLANKDASSNSSLQNLKSNYDFASAYQATYGHMTPISSVNAEQTFQRQVDTSKGIVFAEDLPKMDYVSTSLRKQILEDVPERSAGSRCTSHDLSALLTRNVELTNSVSCLLKTSIAPRTRTQYECGYSAYATFLRMTGVIWLISDMPPLTEESLIHFATHCFKNLHLKCSTIKMYICGIRYKYLENGKTSIFSGSSDKLYRLDALYRGIKKNEKKSTKPRLPITFTVLKDICQLLRKGYYTPYVDILLEAACVTAYFGFLRCGEFTVLHSFDSECNVSIEDIRFLKDKVTFHLKASKTDPFREGVDIHLFASGVSVCPVLSLERYMDYRSRKFKDSKSQDAFFVMENRKALTRNYFISSLKIILAVLGYNSDLYNGHSFRIGASTTAGSKIEDHLIQTLGRWSSQCYTRYIRTSLSTIQQAQQALLE